MNSTLNALLWQALTLSVLPMKLFDSSTGFVLPDRSVLSPDAALVSLDRWQGLSEQQRRAFPPLCPDLVVELASPRDEGPRGLSQLRHKMAAYQRNGARLGWLLIPAERAVEVWGPLAEGLAGVRLENATRLDGAPQFPGLSIDLGEIWSAGSPAESLPDQAAGRAVGPPPVPGDLAGGPGPAANQFRPG
jgi:Uma2 family endonuclease